MDHRTRDAVRRLLISGYGEPPPAVDDSIPANTNGGFDDTIAIPPARRPVESARTWPSADDVIGAMRLLIGMAEEPPGSRRNGVTRWYGQGPIPWSVAALSKACIDAGFTDTAGNWSMPGISPRTAHGFASVADLRRAFEAAGTYDPTPRRGDIAIIGDDRHAGLVETVRPDGVLCTIEADVEGRCLRNARTLASISGFCHLPTWGFQAWSGRYLELGSQGDDVRTFQERLAQRGWSIPVDGVFDDQTQRVVDQFQQQKNLDNDGIVGPRTWAAAWRAPVT